MLHSLKLFQTLNDSMLLSSDQMRPALVRVHIRATHWRCLTGCSTYHTPGSDWPRHHRLICPKCFRPAHCHQKSSTQSLQPVSAHACVQNIPLNSTAKQMRRLATQARAPALLLGTSDLPSKSAPFYPSNSVPRHVLKLLFTRLQDVITVLFLNNFRVQLSGFH